MVKIVPLSKVGGETNEDDATPPNRQPVDPRIWYETQGRSVLEALISDLNSRGHSKLTLREDGDICIEQGEDAVSQEHLNNFPQKVYWPRLAAVSYTHLGWMKDIGNTNIRATPLPSAARCP